VFYIVDGTFEVLISHFGHPPDFIRMLHPGESFGELGVLYDVPRTATVRAHHPASCCGFLATHFSTHSNLGLITATMGPWMNGPCANSSTTSAAE
jgi:putative ABC transport system ATP-binding protein